MSGVQFTGLGVALATPFTTGAEAARKPADGDPGGVVPRKRPEIDRAAFTRLVTHVVDGGADFLVVLGSTGEAATVTESERAELIGLAREAAAGLPIVVGTGHNSTERTIELSRQAVTAGADGLLVVTPYYNKPQPAGIVAHFQAVADELPGVPIIAYNVPGRTGSNLAPETLHDLWEIPEVVALKESSGDLRQMARICQEAPASKAVLAGDDDLALPAIAVGAQGLVSVCGNVAPDETRALVQAARRGDLAQARELATLLAPLMSALFAESNPVPLKAALACMGLATGMVRAPLAPAAPDTWARIQAALAGLGIGASAQAVAS
ncbi:4-hydroxy-tetrahydrodipicolinate synthase [Ornithinicoccus hortensis]|uniref:4-hydroxy-tetrahydrodipicolinate synthase n=1 Tax=Ornithinicoccus hortensis TaxID=82346 RepID=A0A542YLX8_9MICO|nr:4-hydroxy-tetrahydrodipicolinate synthase [Ornithinicoccus hortensis]TQL49051.1 dihydrodipicolinate synthase [Ornithinicoccus hortensis]